jgi:hypothetical protein
MDTLTRCYSRRSLEVAPCDLKFTGDSKGRGDNAKRIRGRKGWHCTSRDRSRDIASRKNGQSCRGFNSIAIIINYDNNEE